MIITWKGFVGAFALEHCIYKNITCITYYIGRLHCNHISGVIITVLASSAVNCVFEPRSSKIKDYDIGIGCFTTKHAALRSKEQRLTGSKSE